MKRYKIIVAYDGTDYQGWQEQDNGPTIVGALQKSFFSVFGKRISLLGASRTDAGVHAEGQVATFIVDLPIEPTKIREAWSNRLPEAISILSLEEVEPTYNPHYNIIEKIYEYTFCLTRPSPFVTRYQLHYRWPIDIQKLKDTFAVFMGTHDFRSFCTGDDLKDTVRTIRQIELVEIGENTYKIVFKGPGFLRYMIRRIVGACLEVAGRPNLHNDYLQQVLDAKNPEHTLPCAAAKGLILKQINYDNLK